MTHGELRRLVYCSRCSVAGPEVMLHAAIIRILASAVRNNARLGVTGALMLDDGWFTQALEGPPEGVEALYARIRDDRRHDQVTLIGLSAVEQRTLPARPMAFLGGSPAGSRLFAGCTRAEDLDRAGLSADRLLDVLLDLARDDGLWPVPA